MEYNYVDGISDNPHKHVWTCATQNGVSDDNNHPNTNCPCAKITGPDSS